LIAGDVEVTADIAEELIQAADQYMLEGLKRLCETSISSAVSVENIQVVWVRSGKFVGW
jgi:hypothetical protein